MTLPHREYAAELAATLTDEVNSDAVQEFLEARGVDYDHTDVDEITHLVERLQDPDPGYTPDPAAVALVRNTWRNAPCPKCAEPRALGARVRACGCILDDDELRDYRARAVLSALAAAGRLRDTAADVVTPARWALRCGPTCTGHPEETRP